MAVGRTTGSASRNDLCRRCGTVIDFLSSCPSCGTVAGIDPTLADGELAGTPRLTLVAPPTRPEETPPATPAADPWTAVHRSALPAELVRAWDVSATPRRTPAAAKRRKRILLGALVVLVAAGVSVGIVSSGSRGAPKTTPLLPVRTFRAPGAPFEAAFPTVPIESHAALKLDGVPYVATAYTAFSGPQMFSATVYPFPLGMPNMSAEQFLRLFTSRLAGGAQLTIPGGTPTTFRHLPALAALLTSPSGTMFTKLLAVLEGHVAYVLMVSGSSPNPSGYTDFVTSFQLASS